MKRLAILTPKYRDYHGQTKFSLRRLKHAFPSLTIVPLSVRATYIHVARQMLLSTAVVMHKTGEQPLDYILWLDSDIAFRPEDFQNLTYFVDGFGSPVCVSGLYWCRHTVNFPSGWLGDWETGVNYTIDWPLYEIHKVDFTGLGFFLMPIDVAVEYYNLHDETTMFRSDNWLPSQYGDGLCQAGEDVYFCNELKKMGVPIYLDAGTILWHDGITQRDVAMARKTGMVKPYAEVVVEEI